MASRVFGSMGAILVAAASAFGQTAPQTVDVMKPTRLAGSRRPAGAAYRDR